MPVIKFKPTQSELEILHILWKLEIASVRQVHALLEDKKKTGYTSTLKLMQLMYEKGFLSRDDAQKIHYYKPIMRKETACKGHFNNLLNNYFGGSKTRLIMYALGNKENISDKELKDVQALLEKRNFY